MYRRWTKEEESFLLNNYEKLSIKDLCDNLQSSVSRIRYKAKKLNIFKPIKLKWAESEILQLKKHYNSSTPNEMEKVFNRSWLNIQQKARSLGINVKKELWNARISKSILDKKLSKYKVNENFFSVWSSDSAYVLGWYYSDGHLGLRVDRAAKYSSAIISISKSDEYILHEINKVMGSNHPIYRYSDNVTLSIRNQKVCHQLEKLGVIPGKKSHIIECPENIPDFCISSFIRGIIDGDGSVECGRHCRVNIYTSSGKFACGLQNILVRFGIDTKVYTNKKRIQYTVRISRQESIYRLFNFLYTNNKTICLTRKRDKMKQICFRYLDRTQHLKQMIL